MVSTVQPLDPELRDLRNVIWEVWPMLGLPTPTPIQFDAADFLQGPEDRKLLMGYRGLAKSMLAAILAVHRHRLCIDDKGYSDIATLILSAGKDFADTMSTFMMRLIAEVPFYNCLMPGTGQLSSLVKFDVGHKAAMKDPSVKSAGIFGQTVGSRAHDIILDDVEVPNTAGTVGMRDKLRFRVEGIQDLLPPEGGRITVLGTPHFEDSLYTWLQDKGYTTRIYPARYPTQERVEILGDALAPCIRDSWSPETVGKPTDPGRFDEERLARREADAGRTHFARQYMLDTSLGDREVHPLRLNDLIVTEIDREVGPAKLVYASNPIDDIPVWGLTGDRYNRPMDSANPPELLPYTGTVMTIDPSGRGKDETAWCVSAILNSMIFVPDFGGFLAGFEDATLKALAETAKHYGVNAISVEANFGDGMFDQLLKPHLKAVGHKCSIVSERAVGQKERRICDTLEPVMNQHRLIIDSGALRRDAAPREGLGEEAAMQYRLAYQISRITRERGCLVHDDRVDVLASAVGYWSAHLDRSVEEANEAMYDEEMDDSLREMDPNKNQEPNWLSGFIPDRMI